MKNFNKFLLVLMLGLMTTATVMAQNVILSENFESGVIPTGWTTIDADGDGNVWVSSSTPGIYHFPDMDLTGKGHNGSAHFVISGSYANQGGLVLTPDNYLVTPELNLSGEATLKYWVCAQDANYPADHYGVFASTGGNTASDFTVTLFEETMTAKNAILKNKKQETRNGAKEQGTWYERTVTIPANTKYIAFRHYNCTDQFILNLDDVTITGGGGSSVNMDRYITLTVQQGEDISLDLYADAANTPIKVVSGSSETTLTIGIDWTDFQDYHAGASTMTVYGNIKGFDCSNNGSKITALDASHNTALEELYCSNNNLSALDLSNISALIRLSCYGNNLSSLDLSHNTALMDLYCYGNNFTTQAYDDLMCSLPERAVADNAWFEPLYNASDANVAIFHNANSANAINKNWKVQYYEDDSEIPATAGNYDCSNGIDNIAAITATLYPNPVKDLLNIISDSEITGYELYDALGRMLINKTNLSSTESVINLSSLENGIYILKLRNENGTAEYKIVKE